MKKKNLKIVALLIAIALIGFLAYFSNGLLGNPVSKMLAKHTAKTYINKTYPETDYYIDSLNYSFKEGGYYAHIRSKKSIDTTFSLSINMLGKLTYDSYDNVKSKFTTAQRLEAQYRKLTDSVFEKEFFLSKGHIVYGTLEIHPEESIKNCHPMEVPSYAIVQEELELDKEYDINELGKKAGHLIVYWEDEDLSIEYFSKLMLEIKKRFDNENISFKAMDLTVSKPGKEGKQPEYGLSVSHFPYEDIYEEGMLERVEEAEKQLKAYYEEEDSKR